MNQHREVWTGSASELLQLLPDITVKANVLTRKLNVKAGSLYKHYGILYEPKPRTSEKKEFTLTLTDSEATAVNVDVQN